MTDPSTNVHIARALAVARLRAWRTALLDLHKILVDAELLRYAAAHGPVNGPHHALKLLSDDPWFQWLRPMLVLVVQMDERLAADAPLAESELQAFQTETRALLQPAAESASSREYQRSLQELPAAVVVHGKLIELLKDSGSSKA